MVTTASADRARLTALMRRVAAWTDDYHSVIATEYVDHDGRRVRFDGLFAWGERPAMDVKSPTAQLGLQHLNSADKTEVLLTGDSFYYSVDPRTSGPLKGKHWMRAPLPQVNGGPATHGLQANPEYGVWMLADATGWTDLGAENLDDTVGRHYQGAVTLTALTADKRLAQAAGNALPTLLAGADSAELDVWVDAHGKPLWWFAKMGSTTSFAVDLFHFLGGAGVPAPPVWDTVDSAAVAAHPTSI
ncbi:hypothetical protein [Actinacidiphila acidipaludis]|uniref:hypothetical protein n=1 Tax=Actinacidiphila acidipaludis TaxID=2873382 RepID=UPI00223B5E30|nr:hypothetical protein [Streptomyces acidipaludis]